MRRFSQKIFVSANRLYRDAIKYGDSIKPSGKSFNNEQYNALLGASKSCYGEIRKKFQEDMKKMLPDAATEYEKIASRAKRMKIKRVFGLI